MKLNFLKVRATNITLFIGYSTDLHAKKKKVEEKCCSDPFQHFK